MSRMRRFQTLIAVAIFVVFATLFALLHTQQYLAVDGAIRALFVYWHGRPIAGGNNHLLYFVNVYVWTKTLALFGKPTQDAFDFIRSTQWMNALAAGGCVSIVFLLCARAAKSIGVAVAAAGAYAFSYAFVLHATSTAEPMVALLWSGLSAWAVASGLAASSNLRLIAGGILLALAMATYQSMVLIGPAELMLIAYWDERGFPSNAPGLLYYVSGCVLGGILIYVPAYAISGTTSLSAILYRFFHVEGGQVYGGLRLSSVLNLPIGFANSLVPTLPADYQGIRWLLRNHGLDRATLWLALILVVVGSWVGWTVRRLALVWGNLERRQHLALACCALVLMFDFGTLIFWDPLYDKLWLQPLAAIFVAWSIIFSAWRRVLRSRLMLIPEASLLILVLRPGYPIRAMVGISLAKALYAIPTWSRMARLVAEHDGLRNLLGCAPSQWACYRFTKTLLAHSEALASCLDAVVASVHELLPDMGQNVAIDGSDLPAYANGQRFLSKNGPERERYSDPDATWGHRSAVSTRKGGGYYGYKVHALVDVATDLPLAWKVAPANDSEQHFALPLIDKAKARGFAVKTAIMDKGYDSDPLHQHCMDRDVAPVIALKETEPVKRGAAKTPCCEHGDWVFSGADYKRKATKWRCPTGVCAPASVWIKASRLHPLIPRDSKRHRDLYRQRGSIEREFGRLKHEWALLPLRVRGLDRVRLHADLTILARLASRLASERARAVPLAA